MAPVYQSPNVDNGYDISDYQAIAEELLRKVGLEKHMYKKPDQISGGQKQRVAIARALVNDPDVIIADEPTGALDAETTDTILDMIKEIAEEGKLVLMVTHSDKVASHCSRVLRIDNGELISDEHQLDLEYTESTDVEPFSMIEFDKIQKEAQKVDSDKED